MDIDTNDIMQKESTLGMVSSRSEQVKNEEKQTDSWQVVLHQELFDKYTAKLGCALYAHLIPLSQSLTTVQTDSVIAFTVHTERTSRLVWQNAC